MLKVLEGNYCFISLPTAYDKYLIFKVLLFAIKYLGRYDDNQSTDSDECLSVIFVISPLPVLIDQYKALYGNVIASVYLRTKSDISPNIAEKCCYYPCRINFNVFCNDKVNISFMWWC